MKRSNRKNLIILLGVCFVVICLGASDNFAQSENQISDKKSSTDASSITKQKKWTAQRYKISRAITHYRIGATELKIVVSKTSTVVPEFVFINLHDNENTSVEAAVEVLERYGGMLVELQTGGGRLVKYSSNGRQFTFDPNRIFTRAGIEKTLKSDGDYSIEAEGVVKRVAEKLLSYVKNAKLVIALHNNSDENYSIKSYAGDGEFATDAKLVNISAGTDIDDFFYVTENDFFNYFEKKNQNVVLQDNDQVNDDGSLSVYCGENRISYINVEAQQGHFQKQVEMLEMLQDLIRAKVSTRKKPHRK